MGKIFYGHTLAEDTTIKNDFVSSIFATPVNAAETWLAQQQHKFISWSEASTKNTLDEDDYLLTFDDGYASCYHILLPLLEKYNIPCLFFITTGFLDGCVPYEQRLAAFVEQAKVVRIPSWYGITTLSAQNWKEKMSIYHQLRAPLTLRNIRRRENALQQLFNLNEYTSPTTASLPYLSWSQLHTLAEHPLCTIGAHTVSHPSLRRSFTLRSYNEIKESRARLIAELDQPIDTFAYPYGSHNMFAHSAVARAGFSYAFTTHEKPVTVIERQNALSIPRFDLHQHVTK